MPLRRKIISAKVINLQEWMEKESVHDLPRTAQVILFVMGVLLDYEDEGILAGEALPLSDKGEKFLEDLVLSGFYPTEEEVKEVLTFLAKNNETLH